VICAADIRPGRPGRRQVLQASAEFQLVDVAGETVEIGGCLNMLTPDRPQTRGTSSMAPNSCLVEIEKWPNAETFKMSRAA
jgi:trimethylamine-N-oxide reductase (cytochrome c)